VHALRQPIKPIIRAAIYDILKDLLALGSKENPGVSVVSRQSESKYYGEFKIQNLLNNYLVMLIKVLLECDLFKILVELSGLEDPEIAQPA
jgi:rapamycin-insensitive companion of mTOR